MNIGKARVTRHVLSSISTIFLLLVVSSIAFAASDLSTGTGTGKGKGNGDQPAIENVVITGSAHVGNLLTGSFDFINNANRPDGPATFKWYASNDLSGIDKTVIEGATTKSFIITNAQIGKYISFEVTPNLHANSFMDIPVESAMTDRVPDEEAPTVVTGLIYSGLTPTGVKLTWSPSTDNVGTVGYNIYQAYNLYGKPIGTTKQIAMVTGTECNIAELETGTDFTFSISAFDAAGNESQQTSIQVITPNASGLSWKSGYMARTQADENLLTAFEDWRGRKLDITTLYIGKPYKSLWQVIISNPPALSDNGTLVKTTANSRLALFSMPLLATESRGKFHDLATGAFDQYHQQVANRIKEIIGDKPIYIRLGWEANRGYEWSYENNGGLAVQEDYKTGWARIARIYKSTIPNARMVWNHLRTSTLPIASFYPGDDVVDVISMDPYDNGAQTLVSGKFADNEANWDKFCGSYNLTTGILTGPCGLLEYAKIIGKPIAFDEWGATNRSKPFVSNGANNSFYVQKMYQFFHDHSDWMEYEDYFGGAVPIHQIFPVIPEMQNVSEGYLNAYHP
jgi:hypothetical protein